MKREFSAGGLVFKREGDQILWLIRKPAPNPGFQGKIVWDLPKGLLKDNEEVETAAVREVAEEVGVEAKIISKLPTIKLFYINQDKEKVLKFITYFVMAWQRDLPEGFGWETGIIKWAIFEEAQQLLEYSSDKELLHQAVEFINLKNLYS